ncbi:MAG: MATE family efflux transporter [Flavobacteriales bacterium]|nr:MATE family efflux transporter [Flavobacteriales bacterium]
MSKNKSTQLGTEKISKLLVKQAVPAAIGFFLMSINMVVDTIFVGKYIGNLAIGAVSIVTPIAFLMSSFGMAIGIGGASVVSRALGSQDQNKAQLAFNNQISLAFIIVSLFALVSFVFQTPILNAFGAKGELVEPASTYYFITMIGVPFLSLAMTGNNNLRAEGKATQAMMALLIPSVMNMILDYVFIVELNYGMEGAAWATAISFISSGMFIILYFLSGKTELKIDPSLFRIKKSIVKEISSIGMISILRQGGISLLMIALNQMLLKYGELNGLGGENAVSVYGIVNRIAMIAFFPLIGIAQGLVPIAGYNYGARKYDRVKDVINLSNKAGFIIGLLLCAGLLSASSLIPKLFLNKEDYNLVPIASDAIFYVFMMSFLTVFQLVGASYYQALGKAIPALLLTLTKQFFFLLPLVLILPVFFELDGIWYSFTIADILSAAVCFFFLRLGIKKMMTHWDGEVIEAERRIDEHLID